MQNKKVPLSFISSIFSYKHYVVWLCAAAVTSPCQIGEPDKEGKGAKKGEKEKPWLRRRRPEKHSPTYCKKDLQFPESFLKKLYGQRISVEFFSTFSKSYFYYMCIRRGCDTKFCRYLPFHAKLPPKKVLITELAAATLLSKRYRQEGGRREGHIG